jgi:hypothetical protein
VRGGFVPREQQQEHHGHDFVRADLSAVLLDAHDLGNQPFATLPANGPDCGTGIAKVVLTGKVYMERHEPPPHGNHAVCLLHPKDVTSLW